MKKSIVCISGKARSGKDTTATLLESYILSGNKKVIIIHYADLLKYICTQFFGWNGEKDEKGRTLLQHVGTDVVRAKDEDFWVSFVARFLNVFADNWDCAIIPDCRFPNEIDKMKEFGEKVGAAVTHLRVTRDSANGSLTTEQQAHSSETALDAVNPDYTIDNSGDIEDLMIAIDEFVSEVLV